MSRIAAVALFWTAVFLIQKFNWDLGVFKALVMLAVWASVPVLIGMVRRAGYQAAPRLNRNLAIACAVLVGAQVGYFAMQVRHPHLVDVATTTLAAGRALATGENPYRLALDPAPDGFAAAPAFRGYKYLPVMALAYLPLGLPFGERGVVVVNLLLQLAVAWLVYRLARDIATRGAGLLAAFLYLSLPLVAFQVLAKGVTDLVAVLPLLLAFVVFGRRPGLAGLCVGLSISAKLLPGALLVPCLIPTTPRERIHYAVGILFGLLPILPFALGSPVEFYNNVMLFNALRPADSTNWLVVAPAAAPFVRAAGATLCLGTLVYTWRTQPSPATRCGLAAFLILATILAAPVAHHNYQLWWLPFYAVLLAAVVSRQRFEESLPNVQAS